MRKRRIVWIVLGAVFLAAAVALCLQWIISSRAGVADRQATLAFLESVLPPETAGIRDNRAEVTMAALSVDGTDYVAIVEVPRFEVKLPVADGWDTRRVKHVPCRFSGSVYDGTMVIGGVDTAEQFAFVSSADVGDEVRLTAMTGEVFTYRVKSVRHAKNADAETLSSGDGDLTLFAKTRPGDVLLVICEAA